MPIDPPDIVRHRRPAPTLILGIGNILLRDEGIGVRVIEAMRTLPLPDDVELCDGGTAGADLLAVICDRRRMIVVDAVDANTSPGTILRIEPSDLAPPTGPSLSLHDVGLVEALRMAALVRSAPASVVIFGVQTATVQPGLELSTRVADAIPAVIERVLAELQAPPGDERP